jgi:hypothetical protein
MSNVGARFITAGLFAIAPANMIHGELTRASSSRIEPGTGTLGAIVTRGIALWMLISANAKDQPPKS